MRLEGVLKMVLDDIRGRQGLGGVQLIDQLHTGLGKLYTLLYRGQNQFQQVLE